MHETHGLSESLMLPDNKCPAQ